MCKKIEVILKTQPTLLLLIILAAVEISMGGQLAADARYPALINSIEMEFVYVPAGSFIMGSPESEIGRSSHETQHMVTLTYSFYIQKTEVTQRQWKAVMNNNPSFLKDPDEDYPAENISWNDIQDFIRKLNKLEGIDLYRLPTEAEWEYVCRAGTTNAFSWGNTPDCSKANYGNSNLCADCKDINPGRTVLSASFSPNAWGVYDMHGNVWEWCRDRFDKYPSASVTDPVGSYTGSNRVIRGGGWFGSSKYCRSANRNANNPDDRASDLGFRLVKSLHYTKKLSEDGAIRIVKDHLDNMSKPQTITEKKKVPYQKTVRCSESDIDSDMLGTQCIKAADGFYYKNIIHEWKLENVTVKVPGPCQFPLKDGKWSAIFDMVKKQWVIEYFSREKKRSTWFVDDQTRQVESLQPPC